MMVPQTVYHDNLNITTAFRGPDPTVFNIQLIPTFYSDEIHSQNLEGYRVMHKYYERGSVVNERTYTNTYTTDGRLSENFSIKFQTFVSPNMNNVRVNHLRSLIDIATQILGLLAGLAFICRFAKFILMKLNVWVMLDREYNILYKDDKRQSVALNNPSDRKRIEKHSDFWENSFPYSNKGIPELIDEEADITPKAQPSLGVRMRAHSKLARQKEKIKSDNKTHREMSKFSSFENEDDEDSVESKEK